jgi:hypothetical protein
MVIRLGMQCGLMMMSGRMPLAANGMSASSTIIPIVPFCPWRLELPVNEQRPWRRTRNTCDGTVRQYTLPVNGTTRSSWEVCEWFSAGNRPGAHRPLRRIVTSHSGNGVGVAVEPAT